MIEVSLSPAIYDVARELLADGATNAEIGDRLCLTEDTVKSHVKTLLRVTDCQQRTEFAVRFFRRQIRLSRATRTRVLGAKEVA